MRALLPRYTIVLLAFVVFGLHPAGPEAVRAQSTVRGFVTDQASGEALPGVNVTLEGEAEALLGAVSSGEGIYAISRVPAGRHVLHASFVGYETYVDTLTLQAGEVRSLNIRLTASETEMEEVVVESEAEGGAARVTAGLQTIRPRDIEMIPAPDVSGDLASYLATLPSVVSLGDQGGQLFIRGGEPSHNLVLLDGMTIYQPFHILGFYSAFPSDILSEVDVYAGGYTSQFSGRISSVIDVHSRNGNKRRYSGSASVAPFLTSALVEGPLIRDRVSVLASARQSVIEQGAERYLNRELPYSFGDVFAKVHAIVSRDDQLSVTAMQTYDRGTLGSPSEDRTLDEVRWQNQALGLRYRFLAGTIPFMGELLISVGRMRMELGPSPTPVRRSDYSGFNYSVNMTYFFGRADWHYGLFWRASDFEAILGGLYQGINFDFNRRHKAGIWLEPSFRLGSGWRLRTGFTAQVFPSSEGGNGLFEPRLRASWQQGIHELSLAGGLYHQEVVGLNDRRDAANVFTAWKNAPPGDLIRATHSILGYRVTPTSWLEIAVEGYYNWLPRLFIAEWTAFPRFTTRIQEASGRSIGMNLRLEVRRPRFYGYVTYGLSSVEYTAKEPNIELWFGQETLRFRPPHDRRHQVNVVASTVLGGFDVSVRWNFGSGLPYTRVIGFDGFVLMNGVQDLFDVVDDQRVIYERPFRGILPAYHRLDVSVDRTFDLKMVDVTVQASVINAYNRKNLLALDLFTLRRTDQLPIVPTIGLKVEF